MEHDAPFKPSNPPKKGYNKTLDKFPEYKEDPLKAVERRKDEAEEKARWKSTHKYKSKPTPSVVTSMRNLKTEFPSIYRRVWNLYINFIALYYLNNTNLWLIIL